MKIKNEEGINLLDKIAIGSIWLQMILICIGNGNKLFIVASLATQIFYIVMKISKKGLKLSKKQKQFLIFLLILISMIFLMAAFGKYAEETVVTTTLVFSMCLCIILVAWLDKENKNAYIILKGFLFFAAFLAIYGIILRFFGSTPVIYNINGVSQSRQTLTIGPFYFSQRVMGASSSSYGIASLTPNPNSLSYYLLYAIIINQSLIKLDKVKNVKHIIYYFFYGLFVLGIIIAGSRLAILLIPVTYIIPRIFLMKNSMQNKITLLILISIVAVVFICVIVNVDLFNMINLNGREAMWSVMPEIVDSHIITGERNWSIYFSIGRFIRNQ